MGDVAGVQVGVEIVIVFPDEVTVALPPPFIVIAGPAKPFIDVMPPPPAGQEVRQSDPIQSPAPLT